MIAKKTTATRRKKVLASGDCGETPFSIEDFPLLSGGHGTTFTGECCVLELANRAALCTPRLKKKYGAPEKFEAGHPSISPVIATFCMNWNDSIKNGETRTRLLRPYVTRILGTKTNAADETTRTWLATDWLVRVQAPAWMELAGLKDRASQLRALPALTSSEIAIGIQSMLDESRTDARAAWNAAGNAARNAARDAARDAAGDAAGDAARNAAGDAAWNAARDAARDAAWDAAGDARAAWDAARDAARDAAWNALAPTVTALQVSACVLLDAMIAVDSR